MRSDVSSLYNDKHEVIGSYRKMHLELKLTGAHYLKIQRNDISKF
jgi:hypothetical protein